MNKISLLLQDLRLELYSLTTVGEGQYIMRGLVTGTSYAASPSWWNDVVRRFTNTNRDRYQDNLARAVDKLLEYADLIMTSAILSPQNAALFNNHHQQHDHHTYAIREFTQKLTCLETCHQIMLIVSTNLEKVKTHYVEIGDVNFALKIEDHQRQLQKTAADIAIKRQQLSSPSPPPPPAPASFLSSTSIPPSSAAVKIKQQQ